jgi:hypothetical protein
MPTQEDIINKINTIVAQLRELLLTLDDYNFDKITAQVMDVQQLSAISADLGTINAGTINTVTMNSSTINSTTMNASDIYGSYIATANGAYPRAEMSNTANLFSVLVDALNYAQFTTSTGGGPGLSWTSSGSLSAYLAYAAGLILSTFGTNVPITLSPTGDIFLSPGGSAKVSAWSKHVNTGTGHTLQQDLDAKANAFTGANGSLPVVVSVDFTNQTYQTLTINFSNGVITSIS